MHYNGARREYAYWHEKVKSTIEKKKEKFDFYNRALLLNVLSDFFQSLNEILEDESFFKES
jgi:hypothetical protein